MTAGTIQIEVSRAGRPTPLGFVHYLGPVTAVSDALIDALRHESFVVDRAGSPSDLVASPDAPSPIVLIDPSLADDLLPTVACVFEAIPDARPVALMSRIGRNRFLLALQRGVAGFCDPRANHAAIIRALLDVRNQGVAIPRHLVPVLVDQLCHGRGHVLDTIAGSVELTDREWEVLGLLRAGRSTAEIADSLYISPPTVRSHVSSLVHKFDAGDRDELVSLFDDN